MGSEVEGRAAPGSQSFPCPPHVHPLSQGNVCRSYREVAAAALRRAGEVTAGVGGRLPGLVEGSAWETQAVAQHLRPKEVRELSGETL